MVSFQRVSALPVWFLAAHCLEIFHRAVDDGLPAQTYGAIGDGSSAPAPTQAPAHAELLKRDGEVCGYIESKAESAIPCADSGFVCVGEDRFSALGCCPVTSKSCPVLVACLPRTSSRAASTANLDRTRYCSDLTAPHCAVGVYADRPWQSYTAILCDSVSTTYTLYDTTSSNGGARTSVVVSTRVATSTPTAGKTITPVVTQTAEASGNAVPVGAIVGGVIGGIALIALIAAGIFLLLRRKRTDPGPAYQANETSQPFLSPPPQGYPVAAADNRFSMMKPPMSPVSSVGYTGTYIPSVHSTSPPPPQSPPPFYPQSMPHPGPPVVQHYPPAAQAYPPAAQAYPPAAQAHPPPQQWAGQTPPVELSTVKSDGEVRELA